MGILSRIKALFSGFLGTTADKLEAKNPQLLIKEAEQKIQKSRKEAQKQLVEIQTWAETVRIDVKETEVKLTDVKTKITIATDERDKKLLTELLMAEEQLENELEEKKRLHKAAVEEAIRVRDNYKCFESEMHSRLRELDAIKTQSEIVAMREKISATNYRYGNDYDDNINAVRRSLNQRCAKITAMEQLQTDSSDLNIKMLVDKAAVKRAEAKATALLESSITAEIPAFH